MSSGFLPIVPELINIEDDVVKLKCNPPQEGLDLLLITQRGCPACQRVSEVLRSLQDDTSIYFPSIVWYLDTQPRNAHDVNHTRLIEKLNVVDVPMLFLVDGKQRILPFPLIRVDGSRVRHFVDLTKEDIYRTCRVTQPYDT